MQESVRKSVRHVVEYHEELVWTSVSTHGRTMMEFEAEVWQLTHGVTMRSLCGSLSALMEYQEEFVWKSVSSSWSTMRRSSKLDTVMEYHEEFADQSDTVMEYHEELVDVVTLVQFRESLHS